MSNKYDENLENVEDLQSLDFNEDDNKEEKEEKENLNIEGESDDLKDKPKKKNNFFSFFKKNNSQKNKKKENKKNKTNLKMKFIKFKMKLKKIFKKTIFASFILILFLFLSGTIYNILNTNKDIIYQVTYNDSDIEKGFQKYVVDLVNISTSSTDIASPEFKSGLIKNENISSSKELLGYRQRTTKVEALSTHLGHNKNDYTVNYIKIYKNNNSNLGFNLLKNLYKDNVSVYLSITEFEKGKIVKDYLVNLSNYDINIFGTISNISGYSPNFSDNFNIALGLNELSNKYGFDFSLVYETLSNENLINLVQNKKGMQVFDFNSGVIDTNFKDYSDREKELIESDMYKNINNLTNFYNISNNQSKYIRKVIKTIVDSVNNLDFNTAYNLIQEKTIFTEQEFNKNEKNVEFYTTPRIKDKILDFFYLSNRVKNDMNIFKQKYSDTYVNSFEVKENNNNLIFFLTFRKELSENANISNGNELKSSILLIFDKSKGEFLNIYEKSSIINNYFKEDIKTEDEILSENKKILLNAIDKNLNILVSEDLNANNLKSFKLNIFNDVSFLTYILNHDSFSNVLLNSNISENQIKLKIEKTDLIKIIDAINDYENANIQEDISKILRNIDLKTYTNLKTYFMENYDVLMIEDFESDEFNKGFEIYDLTHEYSVENKNPLYLLIQ